MGIATLHNGGMAMLGQKIKAKGDYIRGLQQTNIGGFSQSKIVTYNQHDWVNLEQHLMFGSTLA